jgi:hypothetical protein
LFLRIITGFLLISSLASEVLTGTAYVNYKIDSFGYIFMSKAPQTLSSSVSESYLNREGIRTGVSMAGNDLREIGALTGSALRDRLNSPSIGIKSDNNYEAGSRDIILTAADISPPSIQA